MRDFSTFPRYRRFPMELRSLSRSQLLEKLTVSGFRPLGLDADFSSFHQTGIRKNVAHLVHASVRLMSRMRKRQFDDRGVLVFRENTWRGFDPRKGDDPRRASRYCGSAWVDNSNISWRTRSRRPEMRSFPGSISINAR